MIILDTNVVSEPMRPRGDPAVQAWLDLQTAETLYLTATSFAELLVGVDLLPGAYHGRRRWNRGRRPETAPGRPDQA